MSEQKQNSQIEPAAWKVGTQLFAQKHIADIHARGVSKPVELLYTRTDPNVRWEAVAGEQMRVIEQLRAELGEARGEYDRSANKLATLRAKLAERDALLREISNWLVCEAIAPPEDMAQSFTPFREAIDKVLSASAEQSAPSLVECDACPRSSGCVGSCMKVSP
ncbi:hypothetical protein [Pseudomonas taiwanensis]|uniref:hypothetical protein n=1 Tax=Pseudomonas taiwanensis TaxID=470150 RepID=UPI000403FA4D|nr:hypothetical protein [Pseudomonas taiwanensis]